MGSLFSKSRQLSQSAQEALLRKCNQVSPCKNIVGHPLNMSYAVRRFKGEAEVADVLTTALRRYYYDALVRYNLACYWCVMGRVEEAREMLETACKKDESLRELAETDEDLAVLKVS